jgi:16S rRNA (cytidine1402-2'-O)-methyltransferase
MLTLAPTPIGNLEDISFRALKAFEEAELFFCEDTRVTKKLFHLLSQKFDIKFRCDNFKSFHHHNEKQVLDSIDKNILIEKNVVYVSDAGMPGVSDPGSALVQYCIDNGIKYDVIPGANALLSAYAMSGFSNPTFSFFAFLPHKGKQRDDMLNTVLNNSSISILYESPHRLLKLLEQIVTIDPNRLVFLVKEISKLHQTFYKDNAINLFNTLKNIQIKGEWVAVINSVETSGENITLKDIEDLQIPPKQKAKLLSKLTGKSVKEYYDKLVNSN